MVIWCKDSAVRGAFPEVTAEFLAEHSWGSAGKLYPKSTRVLLHFIIPWSWRLNFPLCRILTMFGKKECNNSEAMIKMQEGGMQGRERSCWPQWNLAKSVKDKGIHLLLAWPPTWKQGSAMGRQRIKPSYLTVRQQRVAVPDLEIIQALKEKNVWFIYLLWSRQSPYFGWRNRTTLL